MPRIRKGPGARSGMSEDLLLERNNELAADLSTAVDELRSISVEIGQVARRQNDMLDGFDDDMNRTGRSLDAAVKRIYGLISSGGGRHMCYLILFCFFVFCVIYVLI